MTVEPHLICCSAVMQTTGQYVSAVAHYPNGQPMYTIWSSVWQCGQCSRQAAKPEEWRKMTEAPEIQAVPVNRVANMVGRNGKYRRR